MSEEKQKKGFFKRFGKLIIISISSIVGLAVITAVTVVILLSDKNRFDSTVGISDAVEVIKKNYIEGFENTATTGKFTFSIPEEDFNSVLSKASQSIRNEYVETIYYGRSGEKNHHYFYIDLNMPVITSRVVIDTVAKANKDLSITLSINKITLGKVNAYNFIKDKGILTSSLFDGFFRNADIPITFNEKNNTFTVKPLGFIDNFPNVSTISTNFFRLAKKIGSPVIKVEPSLLGFTLDFSKFRSSNSLVAKDYSDIDIPDFRSRLDNACYDAPSALVDDDTHIICEFTDEELSIACTKSISSEMKEEVTSTLTKKKVVNSLLNVQTKFVDDSRAKFNLIYSFNGYLVDAVISSDFYTPIDNNFDFYFEIQYDINVGEYLLEDIETNPHVQFFVNNLRAVLGTFASSNNLFTYDTAGDCFGIDFGDFTAYSIIVQSASKDVSLSDHEIEFKLTRV